MARPGRFELPTLCLEGVTEYYLMRGLLCSSATYMYGVPRCSARFQAVLLPNLLPELSRRILEDHRIVSKRAVIQAVVTTVLLSAVCRPPVYSTHSTLASPTFSAHDVKTFLSAPHPAHCFATRREGLAFRDVYQGAGSGSCSVHRVGNLLHHRTHQAPSVFAENHDRQFAALQILLVRQIRVGREKHFKPSFLGCFQQVLSII